MESTGCCAVDGIHLALDHGDVIDFAGLIHADVARVVGGEEAVGSQARGDIIAAVAARRAKYSTTRSDQQ